MATIPPPISGTKRSIPIPSSGAPACQASDPGANTSTVDVCDVSPVYSELATTM